MSQKYTKEFKETIVQLHETGYPVSDLVKEYGVANQTENVSLHELQQMRKEMAQFLIKLYQSDEVVGLVDVKNFEFHLSGPLFNH